MKLVSLYNTLSKSLEVLDKEKDEKVGIYCCGPTVYNFQHIGNLRTYIFEDILSRSLRLAGYKVKHVMNITDVGHLASDADDGEDKMALASKKEGKKSEEIAAFYTNIFFEDCKALNIQRPDVVCKATDHIKQMINLIQKLIQKDIAYKSNDNIYLDISKIPDYGKLAGLNLESLKDGARIEVDNSKRNAQDFVLWFTKSKFENHELLWDSPFGKGYPGWHIECSAMSMEYLGESFDIHCGGIDHIPVHHTNEIAQSEGATGKPFAKFWLHGGFLVQSSGKMSKSTGDFLTIARLIEKGFEPLQYRFLCLGTHYRNELSWSWEALEGAKNSLNSLRKKVAQAYNSLNSEVNLENLNWQSENYLTDLLSPLFQDLNCPRALAKLNEILSSNTLSSEEKIKATIIIDDIFQLKLIPTETSKSEEIPEEITQMARDRENARKKKNFAEADTLRNKISAAGFLLEDGPNGFIIKRNN